ncbi:sugar ABC transporter substrate-binding protein [Acidobacteria bacterium ACD]|nr:MAG: sugar ABC transporter substrate-binding protein [Acidobacteriota bacterium]MDL1950468.1 sugar ABC transporter substrate-binding protein [Acidobacteria bacterium ACD]
MAGEHRPPRLQAPAGAPRPEAPVPGPPLRQGGRPPEQPGPADGGAARAGRRGGGLRRPEHRPARRLAAAAGRSPRGGLRDAVRPSHGTLLAVALSIAAAGCAGKADRRLRVGVSAPTQREERWVRDVEKLREEARARGVDLRLQISDNDAARQLAQCENLLAQEVDVLILAPHDAAAAGVVVDRAHAFGVPVIAYDRLVTNADVDLYVSFDNVKVGELQGEFLAARVPKGRYVILSGAPTDNNAKLFKDGAMKHIRPLIERGDVTVVLEQPVKDWQPAEAMKLTEDALTASGQRVDAVLAPNDGTAGGVIQALSLAGLAGKVPVTGQDAELSAAKRVLDGTQSMTVYKDTRALATAAIAAAEVFARGGRPETNGAVPNGRIDVPAILLPSVVVTRENAVEVLAGSGYLSREDLLGGAR